MKTFFKNKSLSAFIRKQRNRTLSFLLAIFLLIGLFPHDITKVYSESNDTEGQTGNSTISDKYSELIGCSALLNFESWIYIVISNDPTVDIIDGEELIATDMSEEPVLVIEDYHWVEETCALWLKVTAADGYTLPTKLQQYPWVFQNYTDVYEEEDWESFSPDALLLCEPAYVEPTYIVSDNGVTVSSDNDLFTELIVTSTEAPEAYYINKAVAYNITPKTNDGSYTGHADVTIPIPEGWDTSKLFGFVIEDDGGITALLGTVTKFGTFQFTVPHFSEVGLLEATAVGDVLNKTIVFGKVNSSDTEYVFPIDGMNGESGRFVSTDGAVQYVVNHYVSDGATTTYVSLTGLDVTDGTEIIVGDVSIVVIVKPLENTVDKLLTGGSVANSEELNPLYDVGISGNFNIEYTITAGDDKLTLSGNTITAVAGATGKAVVEAVIKHPTSGNVVGNVTYNVTVSAVDVTSVNHIHVPAGGTAEISGMTGTVDTSLLDTSVATISANHGDSLSNSTVTITSESDEGVTYFVVGQVLYVINTNPNNPSNDTKKYISIGVNPIENCTAYYAINGGPLYPLTGANVFFEQNYVDGVSIMFFCAPDDGYVTSKIVADNSKGEYYSLSNGSRYDGSDSDAWPLTDPNANTLDGASYKSHGLQWCLKEGNITIAQLRDLFTRALALGCDSVTTFTKNGTEGLDTTLTFIAERLPSFEKTIVKIVRTDGSTENFTTDDPYDPAVHDPLEIGDTVTYQFAITVTSTNITYDFTISDLSIGYEEDNISGISTAGTYTNTAEYVIGKTNGELDPEKIKLYANGEFTNTASLSYSYESSAASGKTETVTTSSVTCRISSIVTWIDTNGRVWSVQNIQQGSTLPEVTVIAETGYEFTGWDYKRAVDSGYLIDKGDGSYTVSFEAASSFTIYGTFDPIEYYIDYVLDGGTLPDGVNDPTEYTIEHMVTIPTPTRKGYTFNGWVATSAEGNWTENALYAGDYILPHRYGNVTLAAQWTIITYTVTWVDENGTVLEIDENVPYGTIPTYDSSKPSKEPETRYKWIGWDKEIIAVTDNITYTAQYDDALGNDYKIYIGINAAYHEPNSTYKYYGGTGNSYHTIPKEPYRLEWFRALRAYQSDGDWVVSATEYYHSIGSASDYISADIFTDPAYTITETAEGITDPTGELIKKYLMNISGDDYIGIIQAWLDAKVTGTDINWEKVTVADCTIIPYVIKKQDNGGDWYVDMVVVISETSLTIEVQDDQDGIADQTFLYKITAENHEGFELVVAVREGDPVTIKGLFPGKKYIITELTSWSWQYDASPDWKFVKDDPYNFGDAGTSGTGKDAGIILGSTGNIITFTNDFRGTDWLNDEASIDNDFGTYSTTD